MCTWKYIIIFLTAPGLLLCDQPFGMNVAPWDAEAPTREQIMTLIKAFQVASTMDEWTAVFWCRWDLMHVVKDAFAASHMVDIQPFFWHKPQHVQVGMPDLCVSAVECAVIGRYRPNTAHSTRVCMPKNPRDRHNFVQVPSVTSLKKTLLGAAVNVTEKPTALAKMFCEWFCEPHDWVVVAGAGAGGEVRGVLEAGMNCIAFEKDKCQSNLLVADLTLWDTNRMQAEFEASEAEAKAQAATAAAAESAAAAPPVECPTCGGTGADCELAPCEKCGRWMCDRCAVGEKCPACAALAEPAPQAPPAS